ncbi:MAG: sugar phosphate nucleotidyltransferase [Bdellovibrionota bacterium]
MTLFIFAAGEGTRFRPQTEILPKPAIPFMGSPMIKWGIEHFKNIPIKKIVVNTFHLPQQITSLFKDPYFKQYDVQFSHEKGKILGSGGGLLNAKGLLPSGEDFFVINGDEFFVPEDQWFLEKAYKIHKAGNHCLTMITTDHPEVGKKFGGVWSDVDGNIKGFGKTPMPGTFGEHNVGLMIVNPRFFKYFDKVEPTNILYDHAVRAIEAGEKVKSIPIAMDWFETGNKEDFLQAHEWCFEQIALGTDKGKRILESVHKLTPTLGFHRSTKGYYLSEFIIDEASVQVENFAVIGEGSFLSNPCHIKRSVVANNLEIFDSTIIDNVKVE